MNKNEQKLKEIKERLELSSPGPWTGERRAYGSMVIFDGNEEPVYFIDAEGALEMGENDFNFIAQSKTDISYLLERIAELEKKLDK